MTQQQDDLLTLIRKIQSHHFIETYVKPVREAEYVERLTEEQAENAVTLASIRQLLDSGVQLDFEDMNHHTPLLNAVTHNNVELIQLLMAHGADIRAPHHYDTPLHRAAEFGADRVVRFLIEQGVDPRVPLPGGRTVLSTARGSRHSRRVVSLLVELLKPTKSQRPPPPKKAKDLSEEAVLRYLSAEPPAGVRAQSWDKLRLLMEGVFVEAHSVNLDEFYEGIHEHASFHPDLVFAAVGLIQAVSTRAPKDKKVKKLSNPMLCHHGNLELDGKLTVGSLLVTGNLTVKGLATNFEGAPLFVGGHFTCETFKTVGPVVIGGDLQATRVEASGNDYGLEVRGTLRADSLVVDKHQVTAGRFDVEERVDT
ncbi:ankyrin repeat domain-containing protein [Myxococcus sp. K15C18031901]|uniref:ankyrin repeat domain-containing protein n=1 Tax=Myxococcus dinghuensis TaxID=2906761 RepID=UPI0020A7B299|nr:ankyrin repeat domain-containing protein [Myxococcus dinghuensis]MCP3100369.1 ankyrin repeat domain-containing protein [Myxococcus dinghuensis]